MLWNSNCGNRLLWKHNYSANVMKFQCGKETFMETQLIIKCYGIPMCRNEILWKPNKPTNVMKFQLWERDFYTSINVYLCLWTWKLWNSYLLEQDGYSVASNIQKPALNFNLWKEKLWNANYSFVLARAK